MGSLDKIILLGFIQNKDLSKPNPSKFFKIIEAAILQFVTSESSKNLCTNLTRKAAALLCK